MIKIGNLTSETYQEHVILFVDQFEIFLNLRYYPTIQKWFFDVAYKDFVLFGVKLALDTLHMESSNMPFDFVVIDESGTGLDPFRVNDWIDEPEGRCSLYMLEPSDMDIIRGVPVPI